MILEHLGHVRVGRGAFEEHVLEQVRHAGFAIPFVARADEHGQVDSDLRFGGVGKEENPQPVFETVLGDSFDRSNVLRLCSLET
ncbi:MAG: hypothetical protein R3B90_01375 [Planctomycetaceae bacterium]